MAKPKARKGTKRLKKAKKIAATKPLVAKTVSWP
jgi:hypothetical protein